MTTPNDPGQPGYGGQQPGYGQQPEYGQPGQPYQAMPPSPEAYGAPTGMPPLANWGQRVGSALIDWFGPLLVAGVFYGINRGVGSIAYLAALAWALYNAYQGGATGQSVGKKAIGTRLLRAQDGQLVGGGLGIARWFVHIVDGLPCYLGYLWPLWDQKRQTFADKILSTVVIKE